MRTRLGLVCMSLLAIPFSGFASDDTYESVGGHIHGNAHRIDISPDQIHLTKDGMYIYWNRQFLRVNAIFTDDLGRYSCDLYNYAHDYVSCSVCGQVYHEYFDGGCTNGLS